MTLAPALRLTAWGLALLALWNPAVSVASRVPVRIAVVESADLDWAGRGGAHDAAADVVGSRLRAALGEAVEVIQGPASGASHYVFVGDTWPEGDFWPDRVSASLVVPPAAAAAGDPAVRVAAPLRMPVVGSPVSLAARVRRDAAAYPVSLVVRESGVEIARQGLEPPASPIETHVITVLPVRPGVATWSVTLEGMGDDASEAGEPPALVDVVVSQRRPRVLVYEPRPSWATTFVRRALEDGGRVDVEAATRVSRGIHVARGDTRVTLADTATLAAFEAVVVGAPDLLAGPEVAGLERFARHRGGAVFVVLDEAAGGAWRRWIGAGDGRRREWSTPRPGRWTGRPGVVDGEVPPLVVSDVVDLDPEGRATSLVEVVDGGRVVPLLASWPLGTGRVVISTALDAWRYREPSRSRFSDVWGDIVEQIAADAPAAVALRVDRPAVATGERIAFEAVVRADVWLAGGGRRLSASTTGGGAGTPAPVSIWPVAPGRWRGEWAAPDEAGDHVLSVRLADASVEGSVPVAVRSSGAGSRRSPDDAARLAAAHEGVVVDAHDLGPLTTRLAALAASAAVTRDLPFHPARRAWWLALFAACAGGEWWLRRRRGAA
ncbi:MAG: hypothetical protein KJ066_05455 [Acidobacteria bacterium]|nr:hypothetical protein [Acidobacteriota bacterium]